MKGDRKMQLEGMRYCREKEKSVGTGKRYGTSFCLDGLAAVLRWPFCHSYQPV